MAIQRFERVGRQVIIHSDGGICTSKRDLVASEVYREIVQRYLEKLLRQGSPLIEGLRLASEEAALPNLVVALLRALTENPLEAVARVLGKLQLIEPGPRKALHELVEGLYDFWRTFDRFMVLSSEPGPSGLDQRPYRSFNATIEALTHLVRSVYRDTCENITGDHPRIYRQVSAGCNVGLIAVPRRPDLPGPYRKLLANVSIIRQVWIDPPMIIDPPMNKRTGEFRKLEASPLDGWTLPTGEWLCYPARVGPLVVFVYLHQMFIGLGCALANLFDLATDEQVVGRPDAIYLYGVPPEALHGQGDLPTVFHDDEENGIIAGFVPGEERFGYFGYLKKMVLTLHNAVILKRGRMPYHGAMVRIVLRDGASANILIIGDTATGKSETLEAFRLLGKDQLAEMRIIADDMGSMELAPDGRVLGYGTEIGAFIRLDDLQRDYAFKQIDRAIIMSPQKVNARVVLPVTTLDEVLKGYPVEYLLYANNYEEVDDRRPVIEKFETPADALSTFREGAAMAKGTTTATGLVHSYFANIFGAPQYRDLHEEIATRTFTAAFRAGVFVGQLRTRLGVPGRETTGPEAAARALFDLVRSRSSEKRGK